MSMVLINRKRSFILKLKKHKHGVHWQEELTRPGA